MIDFFWMMPAFFLGAISAAESRIDETRLPEGQFLYQHQYAGHFCKQAYMRGAIFPIAAIPDRVLREQLGTFQQEYGLNSCTRADEVPLRDDWRQFGLDVKPFNFETGSAEALFRFDFEPLMDWLRPAAELVIEFEVKDEKRSPYNQEGWMIKRTQPLPWRSREDFLRWLSVDGTMPVISEVRRGVGEYEKKRDALVGAFFYMNGD